MAEKQPKVKTHKGAKKRFKITANGKALFARKGRRHILVTKSAKRKRSLRKTGVADGIMARTIRKMLPYA
ncbi:50S ribosomal protein L35 [Deferribacterales bacterium RsTz2092]|nr:50S ribosomal protein L35 [Deferribacterales bacterium]